MAGILQGLQAFLAQLSKNSELQTNTVQSLKEDLLLRPDREESDVISVENGSTSGDMIDVESATNKVLETSNNNTEPQNTLTETLT